MLTPDDIRDMYASMGEQANTDAGQIACLFDVADRTAFDLAVAGDYTLRHLVEDATLERGSTVTVSGRVYTVATPPERINEHEVTVQLVRGA
jgi:hypothetical protein